MIGALRAPVWPVRFHTDSLTALLVVVACSAPVHAQTIGDTLVPQTRTVDGHVYRGTRARPIPVADAWVVLHRIGPDSTGPIDSVRSSPTGEFDIRYRVFGSEQAQYLATTRFDGIVYYIGPLLAQHLSGDDANLIVYDTVSAPFPIRVAARHLLIFAPGSGGTRPIGEVFELSNDSTLTVIGRDASPAWTTHLPSGAEAFQPNPASDIAADAIVNNAGQISVVAALSPGMRQLAFTYTLAPKGFPLSVPIGGATDVVEVLVQEPAATVTGAGLTEVAPVIDSDRVFRRFLARDVKANSVIRVTVPTFVGRAYVRVIIGVVVVGALAMIVAVIVAVRRRRGLRGRGQVGRDRPPSSSEILVRELAQLDATFERDLEPTEEARTEYASRRAALKARLALAMGSPTK